MEPTTRRGRPNLHTVMNLSALSLGSLSLAGVAVVAAGTTYAPVDQLAAGTSLVGPLVGVVLLLWGLAAACWIVALNVRPVPTPRERLDAIDAERDRLADLRVSVVERVLPTCYTTPAAVATPRRVPSPRRRRDRVSAGT